VKDVALINFHGISDQSPGGIHSSGLKDLNGITGELEVHKGRCLINNSSHLVISLIAPSPQEVKLATCPLHVCMSAIGQAKP
jgi:hypothetical protein